jgi:N-acetylmuramoyl-L-alanine amidase
MILRNIIVMFLLVLFPLGIFAQVTGLQGWNIFVDPGHSQNENMPPFPWGMAEAKRNLRVALQLRDILLTETDIDTVYLSRTNDQQLVTLSQRTTLANSLNAAWYHSIHSDASSSPNANSTLLLWGQYSDGREKIPNGGKAMSDIMIQYLTDGMRTYTISGSIGDCSFYGCTFTGPYLHVNRESIMPSELSEAGFHTNPGQNQLFMNMDWLRLEARTFYWSILDYHNIPRPPADILTGIVTDIESEEPLNGAVISAAGRQYTTDTYQSLFYQYTTDPDLLHNGFYYFEHMDTDSVVVTAQMQDYYPDTAKVAISDDFFTYKDFRLVSKIPPKMISSTPADGDTAVSILANIELQFNRPMSRASVESLLVVTPDIYPSFTWWDNDTRLVIRSDSLKFLTAYTLSLPGTITDKYSHYFDGNGDGIGGDSLEITFTTGIDMFPPEVLAFYPRMYEKNVERRPIISFEFNEQLDDSSVSPDLFLLEEYQNHQPVAGVLKHYTVNDRSVLNYFPSVDLVPNALHVVRLYPGLKDLLGNTTTNTRLISFTSAPTDFQFQTIDALESGFSSYWRQPLWSGSTTGTNPSPGVYMAENQQYVNELTGSNRSMELYYDWDLSASDWLMREYLDVSAPRNITFDTTYTLQCYVFGDGGNNLFRFALDEGDGTNWPTHEVSQWFEIDWLGWRLVQWDLGDPAMTGTWNVLGNNGVLDMPLYRMDSFQLSYQPGASVSGKVYIDDLQLVKAVPITGITYSGADGTVPTEFILKQNYPNPFNPATWITYAVPQRVKVKISVFNTLGQLVQTLVSEEKDPGTYRVRFDASNLAAGVYMYQIQAGTFVQSHKMVLLK